MLSNAYNYADGLHFGGYTSERQVHCNFERCEFMICFDFYYPISYNLLFLDFVDFNAPKEYKNPMFLCLSLIYSICVLFLKVNKLLVAERSEPYFIAS